MCGIAGIIDFLGRNRNGESVQQMLNMMQHRGPDNEEIWHDEYTVLGHRRLSVIDLSDRANQPMDIKNGNFVLTYNGEIYNYIALQKELIKEGVQFETTSDSEVVLKGCAKWGVIEFVKKATGMWAFGLWDKKEKSLWLCRDRIGQKPLFYTNKSSVVTFASTFTALRKVIGKKEISLSNINFFIGSGFVPPNSSIYDEINKVKPATCIKFCRNKVKEYNYWMPDYSKEKKLSEEEAVLSTEIQLKSAVKRCLVSDVPLGFNLSGGIDSSLTTAMATEDGYEVNTYTMILPDKESDESRYAKKVALKYKTNHHEILLDTDAFSTLENHSFYHGEPFGDSSSVASYAVAKKTKKHVTVCITGDGGDEVFGGYSNIHHGLKYDNYVKHLPKTLIPFLFLTSKILDNFSYTKRFSKRVLNLSEMIKYGVDSYIVGRYDIPSFEKELLYKNTKLERFISESNKSITGYLLELTSSCRDATSKILMSDLLFNLPGDYCVKVDSANMANSLESRSPFLEHSLIDFATKIPRKLLLKSNEQKYLLKEISRKRFPLDNIYRRKQGFSIPLEDWLLTTRGQDLIETVYSGSLVKDNYINKGGLQECYSRLKKGLTNPKLIWNIIILELWYNDIHLGRKLKV
jgi:asparagine synthase (glutamine-hydrolysing)